ncbi:HAAS signaling domain-containing protein [Mesobacillus thioparans]|uniref:HAAS signaling domain-containing protein n=1 Tax=Mesobacillus thioparans TaxID=370439 RepID=UPI0039F070EA
MIQLKTEFLAELDRHLGKHADKDQILTEYDIHITEMLEDLSDTQRGGEEVISELYSRLGTPQEIAASWREELAMTPMKTQWVFISANLLFFVGGIILTLVHNLFEFSFIDMAWQNLTSIPAVIIFLYLFFWALLGYEIGKGFGHKGRRLMKKTFILSILPNLILMNLTLLKLIPHDWFQPLLSPAFIVICILFTALLYPVCWIGYRWGKKASI